MGSFSCRHTLLYLWLSSGTDIQDPNFVLSGSGPSPSQVVAVYALLVQISPIVTRVFAALMLSFNSGGGRDGY